MEYSLGRIEGFNRHRSPLATEYLAGESGLLTLLGAIVVAAWLLYLLRKRPQAVALAV